MNCRELCFCKKSCRLVKSLNRHQLMNWRLFERYLDVSEKTKKRFQNQGMQKKQKCCSKNQVLSYFLEYMVMSIGKNIMNGMKSNKKNSKNGNSKCLLNMAPNGTNKLLRPIAAFLSFRQGIKRYTQSIKQLK